MRQGSKESVFVENDVREVYKRVDQLPDLMRYLLPRVKPFCTKEEVSVFIEEFFSSQTDPSK